MARFPLFIDLENAEVLIVGGGETARRKMEAMLPFGARITVVSPQFTGDFAPAKTIEQEFSPELLDTAPFALVIAATSSFEVNHAVCMAAKSRNIPINAVDDPENCTFYFPAVVKDGDVVVGISSGGKSPLVARYVKELVSQVLPETIGKINEVMGQERLKVRERIPGTSAQDQKKRAGALRRKLKELL